MLGSFILLVLYITGIIGAGIQLFGAASNVNGACQRYVDNNEQFGPSVNTLAWLEQDSICKCSFRFARGVLGEMEVYSADC